MNRRSIFVLAWSLIALPAVALATEAPAPAAGPLQIVEVVEASSADGVVPPEIESAPPEPEPAAQECQDPEGCEPGPSPFTCIETDGGIHPTQAGTIYFYYYEYLTGVFDDVCLNGTNLREYWCDSPSHYTWTTYWCGNGCSAGRCL